MTDINPDSTMDASGLSCPKAMEASGFSTANSLTNLNCAPCRPERGRPLPEQRKPVSSL